MHAHDQRRRARARRGRGRDVRPPRRRPVADVQLRIYEPPRFFEAFLRGRAFTEVPDITARICGICPVAYQTSAVRAMEDACGIAIDDGPIRELRRLLYCGEWIESHGLHVHMLHAPDFLGYESAIAMAAEHREIVERGLLMKKVGNALMTAVGGREIHPVNVRVGGFYRAPTRAELRPAAELLERAREAALETVRWTAGLPFPDVELDHELVALSVDGEYPIDRGRIVSTAGLDIAPTGSTTCSTSSRSRTRTRCTPASASAAATSPVRWRASTWPSTRCRRRRARPRWRPASGRSVATRSRASSCAASRCSTPATRRCGSSPATSRPIGPPSTSCRGAGSDSARPRRRAGCSGTATRSMTTGRSSTRGSCRRPRRTSWRSSRTCARSSQARGPRDDELRHRCEQAIRNHDPCISCATHFLTLDVERS